VIRLFPFRKHIPSLFNPTPNSPFNSSPSDQIDTMAFLQTAALLGSLAASAYAHGRVTSISVDGEEYTGFINVRSIKFSTRDLLDTLKL
jgi:hypothetical protein